jgi:hypothetical protein
MVMVAAMLALTSIWAAPAARAADCTDFSGLWKGTCTDSTGTYPHGLAVVQTGCGYLQDGTTPYSIPGANRAVWTETNPQGVLYTTDRTTHAAWNADHTEIDYVIELSTTSADGSFTRRGQMGGPGRIVNGQLRMLYQGRFAITVGGNTSIEDYVQTCVYDRVSGF